MATSILEKINKAGVRLLKPLTPEETYSTIIEEAVGLVGADYGSVFLEISGKLERVYASNPTLHDIQVRREGFTYKTFRTRKIVIVDMHEVAKIHPKIREMGIQSDIMLPLSYKNQSIGVLTLQSTKKDLFTPKEVNILKLFTSLASLAIRKTQLYLETKKALESRDLFISMASHELRTPITTISGYVQLLSNKFANSDTTEGRWVKELSWETFRLTQLVNELLAINKIKSGTLNYSWKECSLTEVVQRALMDFKFAHPDHEIVFSSQLKNYNDKVIGDFDKLLQVIINLLDNAAKFSPSGTKVEVFLKSKKGYLSLAVRDYGHGIDAKNIDYVFDGFYRADNNKKEGMGLGLYLAKNIIQQHHGFIAIRSKVNQGTGVEVRLPKMKNE